MSKKVVIIGSGMGGLSCAIVLAKNGYDVTVLEQGVQSGGCLQCFNAKGAKFETGMHFVGSADRGQILDKMMRYLEIRDKLRLSRLDTGSYNVVCLQKEKFAFANGKDRFIEQMSGYFPKQKDNIARYRTLVEDISASSALHTLKYGGTDNVLNSKYQLLSMNEVMAELISDPMLQNVLSGDIPLYAAEWNKTPFSLHAFIMDWYNRSSFRFAGGSDTVAKAMEQVLSGYGAEIRKRSKATKIICDDTKATGVEINGEEIVNADIVISTAHPARTMELLEGTKLIRPAFRRRIANMPQTTGVFSLYLHFKENTVEYLNRNYFVYETDSPWGCGQYDETSWPKGYLYMHFCDEEGQKHAKTGVVLSYMDYDELAPWHNTVVGRRGPAYEEFVHNRALKLIESLNKEFPGIKENIAGFHTSTPLTYRDYTGTERGALYGVAKDVSLGIAGRVPHKTRIPNVFMAGQNINSHGMLGVIVGTIVVCSELLTPEYVYGQIMEA